MPEQPGTRYAIVSDRETTATTVAVTTLRPARNQGSVGGYRDLMVDQLFAAMLGARLDELSQSANAPFLRAAADRSLFQTPRTKDEAIVQALVANDGVPRGLEALLLEIQRVERFGFTATELERAKQARMLGYERAAAESPDRESASRADEYTRNFLQGEALPTIWQELALHRRFVPEITLAELNKLTADWFPDQNRLVVVSAPEAAGITLPDRARARGRRQVGRGEEGRGLHRRRCRAEADGGAARGRQGREDDRARRGGHHRVDALERGDGRPQADQAQRGSGPLPRLRAGRHARSPVTRTSSRPASRTRS